MDWLLKVVTIWLSIDVMVITTFWYLSLIIPKRWPIWWREFIVDTVETDFGKDHFTYLNEVKTARSYPIDFKSENLSIT